MEIQLCGQNELFQEAVKKTAKIHVTRQSLFREIPIDGNHLHYNSFVCTLFCRRAISSLYDVWVYNLPFLPQTSLWQSAHLLLPHMSHRGFHNYSIQSCHNNSS